MASELRDAMRRLLRAALPADGREGVTVPPGDLRAVLQLVKRVKNRTPADSCVVCRHKDREHYATGCYGADLSEGSCCTCVEFVPIADVPFDSVADAKRDMAEAIETTEAGPMSPELADELRRRLIEKARDMPSIDTLSNLSTPTLGDPTKGA